MTNSNYCGCACLCGLIFFVLTGGLCLGFSNRTYSRKAMEYDEDGKVIIPQDWIEETKALKLSGIVLLTIGLLLVSIDLCLWCNGKCKGDDIEATEIEQPLAGEINTRDEDPPPSYADVMRL
uniref:Uncharacterized protein n=1 Tax=Clytia hemisphaerica TaxID=252671 RepID=A0A7M5X8Z5_9CNID|eukprot:TCONS_00028216-protein